MRQGELDPCVLWYHNHDTLSGTIALHVDDMIMGGDRFFQEHVLNKLRETYPFKHWVQKKGEFLGRRLVQKEDFSTEVDQQTYSNSVQTILISKDRRKEKNHWWPMLNLKPLGMFLGLQIGLLVALVLTLRF